MRETPPQVPEGPWAAVLRQALDPQPDARPASARALARALDEVTLRLPGFEEKRPYPGLASFTEEDAEYFFGREAEVEAVWKKLKRPRLLALIGPSGTGKSSFVRAGLLATPAAGLGGDRGHAGAPTLPVPGSGAGPGLLPATPTRCRSSCVSRSPTRRWVWCRGGASVTSTRSSWWTSSRSCSR